MEAVARRSYPSDLTDEQWELIELVIPAARPGGRPRGVNMREVINALLYQSRSGCQWDMLPHDLPPKSTVYEYFELLSNLVDEPGLGGGGLGFDSVDEWNSGDDFGQEL